MKKFLLLFLGLSLCNSHASTAESVENSVSESAPLLQSTFPIRINLESIQGLPKFSMPVEYDLRYLRKLDKTGWEKWIKKYGKYPVAIREAARCAESDLIKWTEFQRQIVENPSSVFKFCHPGTMRDRKNFFISVNEKIDSQRRFEWLMTNQFVKFTSARERISELSEENTELKRRLSEQPAQVLDPSLSDGFSKLSEENATLKQRLAAQTKSLESLTTRIEKLEDELKAEREKAPAVTRADLEEVKKAVEELRKSKAGINSVIKFCYLVNALVDAKREESRTRDFISEDRWKEIVQKEKNSVKNEKGE